MKTTFRLLVLLLLLTPAHGQIVQRWLTQWGTSGVEYGEGVAVDEAGTTWVTGYTSGALGGTNAGSYDLFLSPLNAAGTLGTSVQRGGTAVDAGYAVAVVGGNTVFGVGSTFSPIWDGAAVVGSGDAVAVGYSTTGAYQTTTRIGSAGNTIAFGAAGNATNLLLAGRSPGTIDEQAPAGGQDAFLSTRDSTGAKVWTRVVGTFRDDTGVATAFDSAGNAYLAGYTAGSFSGFDNTGGYDLFVARYDASGNQTLLKQWGTGVGDIAQGIQVDVSGNIYITGNTSGTLGGQTNHGGTDAFLTKLDSSGNVLWTRLMGGTGTDFSLGLALDAAGHVWIGGFSESNFAGHTVAGNDDAYVACYDIAGTLLNTFFWSSSGDESVTGLAAAPDGSVSVSGYTNGTLDAASAGSFVWAASVTTVPEPTTAALLLGGTAFLALRRRHDQWRSGRSRCLAPELPRPGTANADIPDDPGTAGAAGDAGSVQIVIC